MDISTFSKNTNLCSKPFCNKKRYAGTYAADFCEQHQDKYEFIANIGVNHFETIKNWFISNHEYTYFTGDYCGYPNLKGISFPQQCHIRLKKQYYYGEYEYVYAFWQTIYGNIIESCHRNGKLQYFIIYKPLTPSVFKKTRFVQKDKLSCGELAEYCGQYLDIDIFQNSTIFFSLIPVDLMITINSFIIQDKLHYTSCYDHCVKPRCSKKRISGSKFCRKHNEDYVYLPDADNDLFAVIVQHKLGSSAKKIVGECCPIYEFKGISFPKQEGVCEDDEDMIIQTIDGDILSVNVHHRDYDYNMYYIHAYRYQYIQPFVYKKCKICQSDLTHKKIAKLSGQCLNKKCRRNPALWFSTIPSEIIRIINDLLLAQLAQTHEEY